MTIEEVMSAYFEDYKRKITPRIVEHRWNTILFHIYMLKDVMTAKEAVEDLCIEIKKTTRIQWKKNPKWIEYIGSIADLPLEEVGYRFYKEYGIKTTLQILQHQRAQYDQSLIKHGYTFKVQEERMHPAIYIKPGHFMKHSYDSVPVLCYAYGHETIKNNVTNLYTRGCNICKDDFVGGLPVGSEPALVYLLIFLEWKKCKLGYAELGGLSPIEAIHRTSKPRKYPHPYIIGAYDLSTKTKAGILEERLKEITFENKAFTEQQEFTGHTEFRTWETIEQLRKMGVLKTWL
jgi:hypothetical protein